MRFTWGDPTDLLTVDDQRRWSQVFAAVTFACSVCDDEDTWEVDEWVPAGTHHKVRCVRGHVSVGRPPQRFRRPTGSQRPT